MTTVITAAKETTSDYVDQLPDFIRRRTKYESVNYGISNY